MAQDIRKMFQEDRSLPLEKLEKGHQKRFEDRLEKAFPKQEEKTLQKKKKNNFFLFKIAAVLVVAAGVGFIFFGPRTFPGGGGEQVVETAVPVEEKNEAEEVPVAKEYQLSDVSPEFKKIENYYLASLNIELAKLEVNEDNKALVDSFMAQLAELDNEYKRLNAEINENGLDQSSVEAMIANLQLRLDLLFKLKNKIKDINESNNKDYENFQA